MAVIEVHGKALEVDEEGYLNDYEEWSPQVAETLARLDRIGLTDPHWEVIRFLREYYAEYRVAPAVRVLTKAVGRKLGADKGNSQYLYELFPSAPAKQACKIAGLPKPTGCI
jgi:TusE/DsrC/DsvC family sulfur relay protein